MKKGVELSITTMVVAALGLAVLVVFIFIFTSEAGEFSKTTLSCEVKGGECVGKDECKYQTTSWRCDKKDKPQCCFNP